MSFYLRNIDNTISENMMEVIVMKKEILNIVFSVTILFPFTFFCIRILLLIKQLNGRSGYMINTAFVNHKKDNITNCCTRNKFDLSFPGLPKYNVIFLMISIVYIYLSFDIDHMGFSVPVKKISMRRSI